MSENSTDKEQSPSKYTDQDVEDLLRALVEGDAVHAEIVRSLREERNKARDALAALNVEARARHNILVRHYAQDLAALAKRHLDLAELLERREEAYGKQLTELASERAAMIERHEQELSVLRASLCSI
jgi:uncharacterized protein involved in exopolysaccharide biosynthesis